MSKSDNLGCRAYLYLHSALVAIHEIAMAKNILRLRYFTGLQWLFGEVEMLKLVTNPVGNKLDLIGVWNHACCVVSRWQSIVRHNFYS